MLPHLPGRATRSSAVRHTCVCMNTAGCSSQNSQSECHSIPPQTLSSSCCCVLLLLLLTIGCQTFRIMCPLAATATQFIQRTSNPEAGLACSLICTKPRTYSSQQILNPQTSLKPSRVTNQGYHQPSLLPPQKHQSQLIFPG